MRRPGSTPGGRFRRARLGVAGVILCGALGYAVAIVAGGSASAAPPSASALYPALASSDPSGITFATLAQVAASEPGRSGPTWRTEPGANGPDAPLPETIRRLPATGADVSTWIGESSRGGVCVLMSPTRRVGGGYPVGATCSEPAAVERGIALSFQFPDSDETALAGVSPAGVTSVTVALANGSKISAPVSAGGWAVSATTAPVSYTPEPGGQAVTIGGEW